jgi:hypothetical protein
MSTTAHLQRRYLARLLVRQPEDLLRVGEFPGVDTLRDHACRSGEGIITVAETVDPAHVVWGTYRGEPYELPVMVPLIQAIHHATDHRSQIATMLSQAGIAPPDLNLWTYVDALRE